jgi:hypothetical protein
MLASFQTDDRFQGEQSELFDYDFDDPMGASAGHLIRFLNALPAEFAVTLICHSMGGWLHIASPAKCDIESVLI